MQDCLLAYANSGGQRIERRCIVTSARETMQRGVENALTGTT